MTSGALYSCSSIGIGQEQRELTGVWNERDKLLRQLETTKNTAQARKNTSLEEIPEVLEPLAGLTGKSLHEASP